MFYLLFTFGLSLMVATANVFFRDIAHIIDIFLQLWFFSVPVIYPIEFLARVAGAKWITLYYFNPMVPFIEMLATMSMGRGANNIYPFRVGEVVRWALFNRYNQVSGPLALASLLIERVFDGLTMLSFLVVVVFAGGIPADLQDLAWGALALFGVALGGIYALVLWPAQFQALSEWVIARLIPLRFRS